MKNAIFDRGIFAFILLCTFAIYNAAKANPALQEFTSTRSVTSMFAAKDGMLWVGTRGGILTRDATGNWTKQTTQDGLPSNEVQAISITNGGDIKVLFPNATAIWNDEKWQIDKSTFIAPKQYKFPKARWQNKTVQADLNGLQIGSQYIKMPPSTGSYISALLPQEKVLFVAIYGDGIWSFDANNWQKLYATLPANAQQITALAGIPDTKVLFVGTRREGVWTFNGKEWQQHLQEDEPYNNDIQSLILFRGNTFAGTLEDGLMEYQNGKWQHFDNTVLSSNAPRQMAVFQDHLYVRFGNGKVDRFDGENWQRDVFPDLPRGKIYSLAADDKKLYIGQWGGWSEWDGKSLQHFLKIPELQGVPLMVLHPMGNSLWIGTQSLGLIMYNHQSAIIQLIDARHGLPDDWITAIAGNSEDNIFVGTYVGGLARKTLSGWQTLKPVAGENVTALELDNTGGVYIATRHGVWHRSAAGIWKDYRKYFSALSLEAQALLMTTEGLWIGTRTGLYLVSPS